ncbi:MAG: GNAT family N-acetyltransferase [Candidatus Zixiibacteriota bacterium]|nr:MAG: GNAT family N-acetyltransferase [candidate division Zixibacteria bacterium]
MIDRFKLSDAEELYGFMNLPEIREFIPDRFENKNDLVNVLDWLIGNYSLEKDKVVRISLAIREKGSGDFIGWVTYGPLPYDEELKEIGFAIDPVYWNLGYATLAGEKFLEWVRNNVTEEAVYAEVDERNVKSQRVLEKLGFSKVKEDRIHRDKTEKNIWIYRWDG